MKTLNKSKIFFIILVFVILLPSTVYANNFLDTPNGVFNSDGGTQAKNLIIQLASVITNIGPIVILIGIVIFILAKATDNLAQQITGGIFCVVGITMICALSIVGDIVLADDLKDLTKIIINQIINISTYIGVTIIVIGITDIIMGYKAEDAGAKVKGIMMTITGIVLILARAVVALTGLEL
mgnify:CR=1 FL=1